MTRKAHAADTRETIGGRHGFRRELLTSAFLVTNCQGSSAALADANFEGLQLYLGPPARPERIPDCRNVWDRFSEKFPGEIPLEPSFRIYGANEIPAIAMSRVFIGPRYKTTPHVWIILGERFFASPEPRPMITMLHEAMHVQLNVGRLRERNIESIQIDADQTTRGLRIRDATEFSFEADKYDLAVKFRTLIDEILVEQLVQRRFPGYSDARSQQYREMRENTAQRRQIDTVDVDLRCWAILYEIARNDLGVSLATNESDRLVCRNLAASLEDRLIRTCRDDAESLLSLRPRLLTATLDQPNIDFSPYDEGFSRIMTLKKGS